MNRQELAGFLLYSLKPKAAFNLREVLKKSLSNYELSVEQFPLYFVDILGMKPMTKTLDSIENDSLTEYELKALRTMQFWIRNTKCNKVEKL